MASIGGWWFRCCMVACRSITRRTCGAAMVSWYRAVAKSSLDEDIVNGEGSGSESSDLHQLGAESDSSEDEVAPRNTIGDVPLKWYEDEPHIEYDIKGKKIKKKEKQDKLDSFLANVDDFKSCWLDRK